MRCPRFYVLIVLAISALWTSPAVLVASGEASNPLTDVAFDQGKLGTSVPLDLKLRDSEGNDVVLKDYFNDKPVLLNLVYFECPMLCSMAMDELTKTFRAMNFTVGDEFTVLTISFDPLENPAQAKRRKETLLRRYTREPAREGWHFLTANGDRDGIRELTESVGFNYVFDEKTGRYAHAAGIIILTPEGKVSRYLEGVEHSTRDVRYSLIDASNGKIGTVTDQLLMRCYIYDPTIGKYGLQIQRSLQIFGSLTALGVIGMILWFLRKEKHKVKAEPQPAT